MGGERYRTVRFSYGGGPTGCTLYRGTLGHWHTGTLAHWYTGTQVYSGTLVLRPDCR